MVSPIASMPRRGHECLEPLVYVVDDDPDMNDALVDLLHSVGLRAQACLSADQFLSIDIDEAPGCVVLDVRLRGANGLDVQRELTRRGIDLPIVFITGYGDIEMTVQAMKAGAVDFLAKPFRDQAFLDAVAQAIAVDRTKRRSVRCDEDLRGRFATLTDREREVMMLSAFEELTSVEIAAILGVTESSVRSRLFRARNLMADLLQHSRSTR